MQKTAVLSGAAAFGLAGASGTAAAQDNQPSTALVFVDDYRSEVPVRVVSRIQQTTVNAILGEQNQDNRNGGVVNDPTEWNGYIFTYEQGGAGSYNLTFVRDGTLQTDQTYQWGTDATFFSTELMLLEVSVSTGGGGGGGGGDGGGGGGGGGDGG